MKRKTLLFLLVLIAITTMAETALIIKPLSNAEQVKALQEIGYLKLTQDSLFVYSHSDNLFSKSALRDIRHIRYGDTKDTPTGEIETNNLLVSCRVYPNPTQDILIVENANSGMAYIFDLNGHLLQTTSLQEGTSSVNVCSLPHGEYLLLLNTQTYKFIKQ